MRPTDDEIDDVLNQCADAADDGASKYPGMSYEQGVTAALEWMRGIGTNSLTD